ncbi:MAG: hypothetical protein JRG77_06160 [Deltaproteobacteria bacterium]|nr:hypothetical protein [Deltaproteobacteria bacterium]
MLTFGSYPFQLIPFILGQCHCEFLHTQTSLVDYEELYHTILRHLKVDVAIVVIEDEGCIVLVPPECEVSVEGNGCLKVIVG